MKNKPEIRTFDIDMKHPGLYSKRINFKYTRRIRPSIMVTSGKDAPSDLKMSIEDINTTGFILNIYTEMIGIIKIGIIIQ